MIKSKTERNIDDYIQDRVQFKINLYFKKSRHNKIYYLLISITIAVSAALVPLLINLVNQGEIYRNIATVLSLLVTICVALQEIFRFREHWRNYNLIDTSLRREEMLFSMSAGPYAEIEGMSKKQDLFVQRVEDLIEEERKETINMRTALNAVIDDKSNLKL